MITILTPTFNRASYLKRLYMSLKSQTVHNFQWLIIDDGSTDNTETIVNEFNNCEFDIDYYKKENGGKHTALNYSHKFIKGDYVCIVDSDDWLLPHAIELIENKLIKYRENSNIKTLVFRRGYSESEPICTSFPEEDTVSNSIDFIVNAKRHGDCCEVVSTCVFKEFPFPEYPNERFLGEGYLWNNIAYKYDSVYIKDVIYICEYLEGGLSKSGRKLRIQSPLGGMANSNTYFISINGRKVANSIILKESMLFVCYAKFAGLNYKDILEKANDIRPIRKFYFLGVLLYIYWRWRYI